MSAAGRRSRQDGRELAPLDEAAYRLQTLGDILLGAPRRRRRSTLPARSGYRVVHSHDEGEACALHPDPFPCQYHPAPFPAGRVGRGCGAHLLAGALLLVLAAYLLLAA